MTVDGERAESGEGVPLNVGEDQLHRKVAASVNVLFVRRVVIQLLSALSTAILARKLGVAGFGSYGAGLAMYYFGLSVCDFGFGSVLARELGSVSRTTDLWCARCYGYRPNGPSRSGSVWSCSP